MHARFWADFFQGLTPVIIFSFARAIFPCKSKPLSRSACGRCFSATAGGHSRSLLQIWRAAMEIALGEQIQNFPLGSRVLSMGSFSMGNTRGKAAAVMERPAEQSSPSFSCPLENLGCEILPDTATQ